MEKPVEIKVVEFESKVVEVVNGSGIPAFCVTPILEKVLMKCRELEESNLQTAKKQYAEGLAAEKRAEEEKAAQEETEPVEYVEE